MQHSARTREGRRSWVAWIALFAMLSQGCTYALHRARPDDWEERESLECRRRTGAIAADVVVLAGSAALGGLVLTAPGDSLDDLLADFRWTAPGAAAAIAGVSLFIGVRNFRNCSEAQRELRRRQEALTWSDPDAPEGEEASPAEPLTRPLVAEEAPAATTP